MKKEIQAGKSYDSKRRNALKHVRRAISYFDLGKMDKARLWLLKTEKILDEFKYEYDLASIDQTSIVKFKEVIELEEDIDSAAGATEAPKAIEVLTEVVNEIYDDEAEEQNADGSEEDYSSQTKKDSRTFAFSRTDLDGKPITKAIKCGLFITHTKMRDIVQAWNEGLVDKNTQLVLVTSGSDVIDGKKVKVVNHISENFDKQLEETTKEMGYDRVPNFVKRPRFWGRAITSLKVDSKSSLNEDGLVWGDLKGSIQYAFLDYCGMNNMKYLNWYVDVLYQMLGNNYNLAINHFSYVRNDSSKWKERCFTFLSTTSNMLDAIGCQRYMEREGLFEEFLNKYAWVTDEFDSTLQFIGLVIDSILDRRSNEIAELMPEGKRDEKWINSLSQHKRDLFMEYKQIERNKTLIWELQNKTKGGVSIYDNILIDSFFWKASYLDTSNPNSIFTNAHSCWFMNLLKGHSKGNGTYKEWSDSIDQNKFEGVAYMSYSGNNPSSKMTLHKFTGSKKPQHRRKAVREVLEFRDNTVNPFRATVIIGKLDDSDAGKVKICIEDDETLKIEGMSDPKSRDFINNYCMKRYGINPQDSLMRVTKNHTKKLDSLALTKFSEALLEEEAMEEAVLSAWEKKLEMKEMDHETFAGLAFEILHEKQKDGVEDYE